MCIAILNTSKGGLIDKQTLSRCWQGNKDGAGMMWAHDGQLYIHKELHKFKQFYGVYKQVREEHPELSIVLHFRFATHGKLDIENCHPFLVHDGLGFVHNGIISTVDVPKGSSESDTAIFNNTYLKKLPKDFYKNEGIRRLIRKVIGNYNKLIFLNSEGKHRFINEEAGVWDEGNWYSNTGYKPYTPPKITYGAGSTAYSGYGYTHYPTNYGQRREWEKDWEYDAERCMWMKKKNHDAVVTFQDDELPLKSDIKITKEEREYWPECNDGSDVEYNKLDSDDMRRLTEQRCSECDAVLNGKMEKYYGACTKCLVEYGLIPDSKN